MEIIIFDTTRELYKFLRDTGGLDTLQLFRDTPQKSIPADNTGYVVTNSKLEVLGAASLYEEEPGVWFNELFEVAKEHQRKGIGRKLYKLKSSISSFSLLSSLFSFGFSFFIFSEAEMNISSRKLLAKLLTPILLFIFLFSSIFLFINRKLK